jgi:MATE family multidrug resistance protein
VGVNLFFTSASARQGAVILSVNTVMLQLFLFFSYFMDGFAYAGEALGGRFYGARDGKAFRETLHRLFGWTLMMTTVFTLLYIVAGIDIVRLLTDEEQVRAVAREYIWWVWLVPAAGAAAFIWDGIFVGITDGRGMLVATALATLAFAVVYLLTKDVLGNDGLWLAQIVYLSLRGIVQTVWYRQQITRGILKLTE